MYRPQLKKLDYFSKSNILDGTTQGQMSFYDATLNKWTYTETSEMFWDNVNKRLGLGTTPAQALDVAGKIALNGTQIAYMPTAYTGTLIIGDGGGSLDTGADYNTFVGIGAGFSNTTGRNNTANGYQSLYSNTTGSYNTANGMNSLYANTEGSQNFGLGYYSGSYIADGSTPNETGSNNTFIGANTKALADGDTNETVIGNGATGIGSNTVVLGNDSITKTALKGDIGIGTTTPTEKLDVTGNILASGTVLGSNLSGTNTGDEIKATGTEINTGTDDVKYATPKAIKDSKLSYTDGTETLTNKTLTNPATTDQTLTSGETIAWDMDSGDIAKLTLGVNATLSNPTNLKDTTYIIKITQDGTGSRTLAYGTAYKWAGGTAPTLSTDADAVDIITFVSDGTNMYGSILNDFS